MEKSSAAESWTVEDEAAMQALIARRGRVSTAMIGDNRMGGSMSDAAKRRCDESESSFTHLDYEDFGMSWNCPMYKKKRMASHAWSQHPDHPWILRLSSVCRMEWNLWTSGETQPRLLFEKKATYHIS